MTKQKALTKAFFNQVADEWYERTYDPRHSFLKFPSNRVRMQVALDTLARLNVRGRILDIGCGTGEIVLALRRRGRDARGFDIAERMIEKARENFRRSRLAGDPEAILAVGDLAGYRAKQPFRAATALGLLEYLGTDKELFTHLKRNLTPGGYALVECRNKFFNLFSGNAYTERLWRSGEGPRLIEEIREVDRYSPERAGAIPVLQAGVTRAMKIFLDQATRSHTWSQTERKSFTNYPKDMVRRQHTPRELERSARVQGFDLHHVVWWHLHPYPPRFESQFPGVFNKLAILMGPLGRTPYGAFVASSFLAVLRKR